MSSTRRSVTITVDLSAIVNNYAIAKQLAHGARSFAVVKANAYGHGAVRVAQALTEADGFAVVSIGEAIELREADIQQPILVLQGPHRQSDLAHFRHYALWPVIHHQEQLQWLGACRFAAELQPWLKVDSGMGRLGFNLQDAERVLASRLSFNWFGALTHFANADEPEDDKTTQQINAFREVLDKSGLQTSLANSAGTIRWPQSVSNWHRPGIMLYGSNPLANGRNVPSVADAIRPAMQVTAPIISIKQYQPGATIGYAGTYTCPEDMTIVYAAVGYGDGLPRVLDANATVSLNGARCPVVGRVSMDSIAIDARNATEVRLGDAVTVWGPEHPVEPLADSAGTISYELFTSIRGTYRYI